MAQEPHFDKVELKKDLVRAKKKPMMIGIGMHKDGQPLIQLHRSKQPRAVANMLKDEFGGDAKNLRWGTAFVDMDDDPKLVIMEINKPIPGFARKMKKQLKGTGFAKIRITFEDGSPSEDLAEDDDDEEEADEHQASAEEEEDEDTDRGHRHRDEQENGEDQEEQDAQVHAQSEDGDEDSNKSADSDAGPVDNANLSNQLRDLIKRMIPIIGKNKDAAEEMRRLAKEAQAALKDNDPSAQEKIDELETELNAIDPDLNGGSSSNEDSSEGDSDGGGKQARGDTDADQSQSQGNEDEDEPRSRRPRIRVSPQVLGKARDAWRATRGKVTKDVDSLHDEISKALDGHDQVGDITKAFRSRVEELMSQIDEELAEHLHDWTQGNHDDDDHHERSSENVRKVVARYRTIISNDETLAHLEVNPFRPINVRKTLEGTLDIVERMIG